MAEYRKATIQDLERLWNTNIAENPDDPRWASWKQEYISINQTGKACTFAVVIDGEPVGEGTLLFSPDCSAISGRTDLAASSAIAGNVTANINALRIRKPYEGQGHISTLVRLMEAYAAEHGITRLTIGVEAKETRNLAIYLHWGYTDFVTHAIEDGELVLYYAKNL